MKPPPTSRPVVVCYLPFPLVVRFPGVDKRFARRWVVNYNDVDGYVIAHIVGQMHTVDLFFVLRAPQQRRRQPTAGSSIRYSRDSDKLMTPIRPPGVSVRSSGSGGGGGGGSCLLTDRITHVVGSCQTTSSGWGTFSTTVFVRRDSASSSAS
jgi:hypothetical protein